MKILVERENMFLVSARAGTSYTFKKEEATDISNMKISEYIRVKNRIEKEEGVSLELSFI